MLKHLLLLPFVLLLAACSLTQYSVSEGEINQYLKERVAFEKQLGIPGIMSSKIRLDDMQSRIGRSQADKVELDAAGELQVASPLGSQQMKIRLSLRARPDYVAEQGAIYLRDLGTSLIKTYAGGSLEFGNVWDERSDIDWDSLRFGGSLFVGADTIIGPLYLGYGQADSGNGALYLFLGRPWGNQQDGLSGAY